MISTSIISATLCLAIGLAPTSILQPVVAPTPSAFESGLENQLGLTFSPDGGTAFWVAWNGAWGSNTKTRQTIFVSRYQHDDWTDPAPVTFSGEHSDSDPFVSPDGKWLYFVSDRPSHDEDTELDDNIWRYDLNKVREPEFLSVNSKAAEYSPVATTSGALYFASARKGGVGQGDLYRAAPLESGFGKPEIMSAALNSPDGEWNLWVSADEQEIIFEASSRPTNMSMSGDLYYSWRTDAGWNEAVHLESLSSFHSDLMPRLHPNGRTLYYTTAPIGGHARIVSIDWKSAAHDSSCRNSCRYKNSRID